MKKRSLQQTAWLVIAGLVLSAVFVSYFRPGLIVALGGQLLAWCGW